MNYPRPSLTELSARIEADLSMLPGPLRGPLSTAWARASHGLYGHLEWIDRQCNPLTCDWERLRDWGALYGVTRLPATSAVGEAETTGSPGSVIFAQTLLRGPNGLDYHVLGAVALTGEGAAKVALRANGTGEDTNLPEGARLTLIDPLPGVAQNLTVAASGLTGGAGEESVEDWRGRVADEWQAMTTRGARGGRAEDYDYWCRSAHPAVSKALVFPHALGLGTLIIRPVCDGNADRQPTAGILLAITDYLAGVAPATADWRLSAPLIRPVEVVLRLSPTVDNANTRTRIAAAIQAAVLSKNTEEALLKLAELDAAIATVTQAYTRLAPTADIAVNPGEVLVFKGVTWE